MPTPEETLQREMVAYGMSQADVDKHFAEAMKSSFVEARLIAISMLSDAQEIIEAGRGDVAIQRLNIVKYLIGKHLRDNPRAD